VMAEVERNVITAISAGQLYRKGREAVPIPRFVYKYIPFTL